MKSVQFNTYGSSEVIKINSNTPTPVLKTGQILVENHAASINPIDSKLLGGTVQKKSSMQFPITLGGDFAGTVSQVGEGVSEFKIGDEVFGQAIVLNGGSGSMAEFVAANTKNTALKPASFNFEESAALPLAGASAIQAIEEHIHLKPGQKLLIHGGAGGIGHLAIQIAKSAGAYVAVTAKAEDFGFVKNMGADETIDYKTQKFEEILHDYDAVFDTVGGEITDKSFAVLKKGGILVSMAGKPNVELAEKYEVTAIGQFTKTSSAQLARLAELVEHGAVKPHVSKIFSLDKTAEAFNFQETQPSRGKVVIKIK